jgi:hypothetical protein
MECSAETSSEHDRNHLGSPNCRVARAGRSSAAPLKQMVLDAVTSAHSKRNYAQGQALDDLFMFAAGRPITRALLMEWRTAMDTADSDSDPHRNADTETLFG